MRSLLLAGLRPQTDPPLTLGASPDLRVLSFNLAISLATALLFGLLPALQAVRADVAPTLKDQANAVAGSGQGVWRKGLVCVQVSLSLVLLIGAGLFVATLRNRKVLSPGFEVTNLPSFSVDPTLGSYGADRSKLFYRQLNEKLDALPGVRSSVLAVVKLLSFDEWDSTVTVEGAKTDLAIVGLVRDTKYMTVHANTPRQVFFPYLQNNWANEMTAYVRAGVGSAQMFLQLRAAVHGLAPNLPIYALKTEESQLDDSLALERLTASLASAFGLLATVLAAVGLYRVIALLVSRRTREIGIRMAFGATSGDVLWFVMREVFLIASAGVAFGLPAVLAVTRLVRSQLYGMSPSDPVIIALAIIGILIIAALSSYLPARRRPNRSHYCAPHE